MSAFQEHVIERNPLGQRKQTPYCPRRRADLGNAVQGTYGIETGRISAGIEKALHIIARKPRGTGLQFYGMAVGKGCICVIKVAAIFGKPVAAIPVAKQLPEGAGSFLAGSSQIIDQRFLLLIVNKAAVEAGQDIDKPVIIAGNECDLASYTRTVVRQQLQWLEAVLVTKITGDPGIGPYPQVSVTVFCNLVDKVGSKTEILTVPYPETRSIIAVQALECTDPYKTLGILENFIDSVIRNVAVTCMKTNELPAGQA